jgi:phosphatidylglycerol:prolipoprotein diacylglycerol transferase
LLAQFAMLRTEESAVIPYLQIPSIPIFDSIAIHPFGVLVATGILTGARLTIRRGAQLGLAEEMVKNMIFWSLLTGFLLSHFFDVLIYQEHQGVVATLKALIDPRSGLSSMFGFGGAVLGLFLWCRVNKQPVMAYADSLAYGLAVGWMFGRLGCYVAHDHPGNLVAGEWYSFMGVNYPCPAAHCPVRENLGWIVTASEVKPEWMRYDMGFFEVVVAAALATFYAVADFFRPRMGFFVAAIATYYGPVRFVLDYLRVKNIQGADPRYFGLTPAQYSAIAVMAVGAYLCFLVARRPAIYRLSPAQLGLDEPPAPVDAPPSKSPPPDDSSAK